MNQLETQDHIEMVTPCQTNLHVTQFQAEILASYACTPSIIRQDH
jgi:hypothetical protein